MLIVSCNETLNAKLFLSELQNKLNSIKGFIRLNFEEQVFTWFAETFNGEGCGKAMLQILAHSSGGEL